MLEVTVCTTYWKEPGAPPPVLLRSCAQYGIPVQEFGTANRHITFWRTKLLPLLGFLESVKTSLVMFLDGNDSFVVSPADSILATYRELADGRVLVGSELVCWPYHQMESYLNRRARAAGSTSPYRYLDTGLLMGPPAVLATMIRALEPYIDVALEDYTEKRSIAEDDVGLFSLAMHDTAIDPVIDYGCRMICAIRNTEDTDWEASEGRFRCLLTDSEPHIVHPNGHRRVDRLRLKAVYAAVTGDGLVADKIEKKGYSK